MSWVFKVDLWTSCHCLCTWFSSPKLIGLPMYSPCASSVYDQISLDFSWMITRSHTWGISLNSNNSFSCCCVTTVLYYVWVASLMCLKFRNSFELNTVCWLKLHLDDSSRNTVKAAKKYLKLLWKGLLGRVLHIVCTTQSMYNTSSKQ